MTISRRQTTAVTVETSTVTSIGATLSSAPVSGNLLVFIAVMDKSVSGITAPSGFTLRASGSVSNVSVMVATKISDGSETGSISGSWTTARMAKAVVTELQASGGATIGYDTATQNMVNTAVSGLSTGTITTGANATYALVMAGKDSAKALTSTPDPSHSWTNSFTSFVADWTVPTEAGEPALIVAENNAVTGSASWNSTFDHDGATDQFGAAIISFTETGGGGGGPTKRRGMQNLGDQAAAYLSSNLKGGLQ